MRQRQAAFFSQLAETAEQWLAGPEKGAWLERLEHEHGNFRAALSWATERGEEATVLHLAARLLAAADAAHGAVDTSGALVDPANRGEWERMLTSVRQQLPEPGFTRAWQQGSALTLQEAVEVAQHSLAAGNSQPLSDIRPRYRRRIRRNMRSDSQDGSPTSPVPARKLGPGPG
jgi:hypothetical protein